jgi:hypothetical protein
VGAEGGDGRRGGNFHASSCRAHAVILYNFADFRSCCQFNQPMNPVDLVNHRLRHPDIDYEYRPSSYWEPASDVLQTVLRKVKGTRRREMITDFFRACRLNELAQELASDELSDSARERLGRVHPTLLRCPARS